MGIERGEVTGEDGAAIGVNGGCGREGSKSIDVGIVAVLEYLDGSGGGAMAGATGQRPLVAGMRVAVEVDGEEIARRQGIAGTDGGGHGRGDVAILHLQNPGIRAQPVVADIGQDDLVAVFPHAVRGT